MLLRQAKPRRPVSVTSLIDVIFLLLLFFMLSSTFARYSEVEIGRQGGGGGAPSGAAPSLSFLQLGAAELRLDGAALPLDRLAPTLSERLAQDDALMLLVQLRQDVLAQRLTDLLVALRGVPGLTYALIAPK
jgi:biopolymer transport protein ExbD